MSIVNNTENQHFLSQTEQRLNVANPNSSTPKIFAFTLKDRENHIIELENENGFKIENTLSFLDLFSFNIDDRRKLRENFENHFNQYESDIKKHTESLLRKIRSGDEDLKEEILNLFISKIINFVRNPFSVKKVLNTFGLASRFVPTDRALAEIYTRVIAGNTPHQKHLCLKFGISEKDYKNWLATIFMLLERMDNGGPNQLELVIKDLYENTENQPAVIVFTYEGEYANKRCLLSDRGYNVPLSGAEVLSFDFNLCSNAFIRYAFVSKRKLVDENMMRHINSNPFLLNTLNRHLEAKNNIKIQNRKNDLDSLVAYNKNTIYQCHSKVYCATKDLRSVIF